MIKIAINGLGRIGRLCLKNLLKEDWCEVVLINTPGDLETLLHLLRYDSTHGIDDFFLSDSVKIDDDKLVIGNNVIKFTNFSDHSRIPLNELEVELVLECSGKFLEIDSLKKHTDNGAKKVIISAPAKSNIPTIVYGVNHNTLKKSDQFISASSCTTNCLAPVVKIINDEFKIINGFMTTVHAYTSDQNLLDGSHKDLRRARSAARSIVPTSTGAAKSIGLVLPELNAKLKGSALRVPVENASIIDLTVNVRKSTSVEELNELFKRKAQTNFTEILRYTDHPIVSIDIVGDTHSAIFDAGLTDVHTTMVKVMAWYDNEVGYAKRMCDLAKYVCDEKNF